MDFQALKTAFIAKHWHGMEDSARSLLNAFVADLQAAYDAQEHGAAVNITFTVDEATIKSVLEEGIERFLREHAPELTAQGEADAPEHDAPAGEASAPEAPAAAAPEPYDPPAQAPRPTEAEDGTVRP